MIRIYIFPLMRVNSRISKTHRNFHGNDVIFKVFASDARDTATFTLKTCLVEKSLEVKSKGINVNFKLLKHYYNLHGNLDCEVACVTPNNDSQCIIRVSLLWVSLQSVCFELPYQFLQCEPPTDVKIGKYLAFLRREFRQNPAQFSPETLKQLGLLKFKFLEHHHVGFNVVYSALTASKVFGSW